MDLLISDLDKEMAEAETQEKNAQSQYEATMTDSAQMRALDSKALTLKGASKASMEQEVQQNKDGKMEATRELVATLKYISALHGECDWLLRYFDARKGARAGEVDSLNDAKAVLQGADFS